MRETDELMNEIAKEVRELGGVFNYIDVYFVVNYRTFRVARGKEEIEEWMKRMVSYVINNSKIEGYTLSGYKIYE